MAKLILLLLLLLHTTLGFAQFQTYRLDKMMGTPVGGPRDVAVSRDGFMYMIDGGITKLDSTGRFVPGFSETPAARVDNNPQALAVDAAGNVYVSCYNSSGSGNFIRKFGPNGNQLLQFGSVGTGPGQFQEVHGMCVDAAGRIYVVDYYATSPRLQCFSTQGALLFEYRIPNPTYNSNLVDVDVDPATGDIYLLKEGFEVTRLNAAGQLLSQTALGRPGTPWASYERATALLVQPGGDLLVTGVQKGIMRFSPSGTLLSVATPFGTDFTSSTRTPLARDAAGNVYATVFTHQQFSNHIYKLSPAGALLKRWGNLTSLSYVRQDEAGNVYTVGSYSSQVKVYNPAGQLVLTFGNGQSGREIAGLSLDALGNVYVLETSDQSSSIQKYNSRGQFMAKFESFGVTQGYQRFSGLAVDAGGNMYVADYFGSCIRKISASGAFLRTIGTRGTGSGQLYVPKAVAVDLRGNVYAADYDGKRVQKFSPTGQVLRQFGPSSPFANPTVTVCDVDLEVDGPGNVYVASSVHAGQIFAADGSGQRPMPSYGSRVSVNRRATRLLSMNTRNDLIRFYVSTQLPPENLISGRIYHDANTNCAVDAAELPLPGLVVVAEPGNYYGITDENGAYTIAVDTGRYEVRQLLPVNEVGRTIQQVCASNVHVGFQGHGNSVDEVNFANAVSTAPYLRVAVSSNRRRRCFRNVTTVSYGNNGFAAATGAEVAVTLPPEVIFISATAPHTVDAAGRYVFRVGTLQPNDGGTTTIQDSVACGNPDIRGLTVCTQASITPLNTYPTPPILTRTTVTVQGSSQPGNQARFVLRNTSAASMPDSLALRVYQNSELSLQHRYQLAAGDSLVLRVAASRPVVRVEADQPVGHPTQRVASATVEVRALGTPGQPNPDMLAMPPNVPGPETAEDCQPIIDSFDPNDKQVAPTGTTAQHYTPTGVPLRYQIRFQNTGTDDAYRVEVVDTLAANLDLRTLRVGTASHPFRLAVTGHGRPVLTFTFDNINLPPSLRDEAGSNGFVQFSIQPKAGLPARALVANEADIFFDYNPPIRTNVTTNRIYDVPLAVVPAVALAYPAVLASPAVAQFVPTQGRAGSLVTISGQRFAATSAANTVRFNGVATPVLSATATSLTVRVPAGATSGLVQVVTGEGAARSAQPFTIHQPPTLAAFAPAEGVPGSVVTLTGTHFSAVAAQDTVWFNGVGAVVRQASATALQVVVPAGAFSGKIRVNTLGGQVESAQAFTVWYPPTLTAFSPARGKAGDVVTITGSNFAPATRNDVGFGSGAAPVLQASTTQLQVRVPAGAQSGPVRVLTPGGVAVSAASFTFLPAPAITAFAPIQASVGDVVNLTGTNFLVDGRPDTLFFGGVQAAVLTATATTASIRVPKGAQSGPLTVAGTGGRSNTTAAFTVLDLTAAEAITVYPNPAHGLVTLDWHRADFTLEQVQVYNAIGQLVANADLRHSPALSLPLPFRAGQTGLHLLVIQTSRGPVLKRITLY